jgi:hypothetical protein
MRRQIATIAAALAVMLAAACSSDPAPVPAPASSGQQNAADGGSEVDRSSAESTALAFARKYAAGNLPQACELVNDNGRKNLGTKCNAHQEWSTTVTLTAQCSSLGRPAFHFTAAAGTINRNSDLIVKVVKAADGMWAVDVATTPASIETDMMGCDSASSKSSAVPPASVTSG